MRECVRACACVMGCSPTLVSECVTRPPDARCRSLLLWLLLIVPNQAAWNSLYTQDELHSDYAAAWAAVAAELKDAPGVLGFVRVPHIH